MASRGAVRDCHGQLLSGNRTYFGWPNGAFSRGILRRLLTDPGDLVLDPFAGSGTTLNVAERLGRRALGVEILPEYARLAREGLTGVE